MRFERRLMLAIIIVVFTIIAVNCVSDERGNTLDNGENHSNASISATVFPADIDPTRGTIGGIIYDDNGVGIPGANVTLWNCHYDVAGQKWVNDNAVDVDQFHQLTKDIRFGSAAGQYSFCMVPQGTYAVVADKEGHNGSAIVTVSNGTATCLIHIPGDLLIKAKSDIPPTPLEGNSIWGIVSLRDMANIPNANVSLWNCKYDSPTGQWVRTTMVDMPGNPQKASNGTSSPAGVYRFDHVPGGKYYVLADDNEGYSYYAIADVKTSLTKAFVVLPDPICRLPPAATPTAEPIVNIPEPTKVYITAEKQQLLVGGQGGWIVAQLYNKGEPLRKNGVNLTFNIDNDNIATLPPIKNNTTDKNGASMIYLDSTDNPGRVKITVSYNGSNGVITNSTYVDVVMWGNIAGLVRDKNDYGPPNTNVSLWSCHYNDSTGKWEKDDIMDVPENPQLSNDGRTGPSGQFTFYRVPAGTYAIMAEKEGYSNSSIVTIEPDEGASSSKTCIITLPDYEFDMPGFAQVNLPSVTLNGGTIWGIVVDPNKVSIANSNVTLWYSVYNSTTSTWEKGDLVNNPKNPQYSSDNREGAPGVFQYDNVQQGVYYVMAEKQGFTGHAIVKLNSNLAINYIVFPYYSYIYTTIPPPTPTPKI